MGSIICIDIFSGRFKGRGIKTQQKAPQTDYHHPIYISAFYFSFSCHLFISLFSLFPCPAIII